MAITHAIAHSQPGTHTPPAALLDHLNDQLAGAYAREGTFVTAFYGILDPRCRTLTYSRAGHNPPRLVRGEQVLSLDEVGGLPMGIAPELNFEQLTVELQSGDLLVLYTDGITEAEPPGSNGEKQYGLERFDQLLRDCGSGAAQQCVDQVCETIAAHCEHTQPTDDQTMIAMRVI